MLLLEGNCAQQGTQDWLDFRKSKIGASEAAIIMGKSPWKKPVDLWKEKTGRTPPSKTNSAMQRGNELEPAARFAFELEMGACFPAAVALSSEYDWMMASLDGLSQDRKSAVEIKCPGEKDHQCALDGEVPEKYIYQLQHQMYVLELDKIYYFSFDGKSGKVLEVYANKALQSKMIEKELEFYTHLTLDTEPNDYPIITEKNWLDVSAKWLDVRTQIERLEKEEQDYRETIISMANQADAQGGGIRMRKTTRQGNVDYSKIPELKSVDLEKYRKPESTSFRIERI
jgi:putative phage-type endonuclease